MHLTQKIANGQWHFLEFIYSKNSPTEKYQPYITCLYIALRWGGIEVMTGGGGGVILGSIESTEDRSLFIQAAQWH